MARFGKASEKVLKGLEPALVRVYRRAIKTTDFSMIESVRSEEVHESYIKRGVTSVPYTKTRHKPNERGLSGAGDAYPYPFPGWDNIKSFSYLAGIIRQCAIEEGVEIRQGIDWDGDGDFTDQSFHDLPHTELKRRQR